jgi:hypothetical protein
VQYQVKQPLGGATTVRKNHDYACLLPIPRRRENCSVGKREWLPTALLLVTGSDLENERLSLCRCRTLHDALMKCSFSY